MGRLDGKVAVITGAGQGMGRVGAILFAKEGAKVVIADIAAETGEETIKMIKEAGGEATFVNADVSKTEDVKKMIKTAIDTYGKLDVLYNNAGINPTEVSTVDCTEEIFDTIIATNLKGVWLGMKYAIPEMLKTGGGSIINTASNCAYRAYIGIPSYSATKAGVIAMSRVAAVEYASKNIRINCLAPGPTATPLLLAKWPQETLQLFSSLAPRGQLGKPEEVAQAALFLASDESSHIIAQVVVIDGGMEADVHLGCLQRLGSREPC